MYDFNGIKMLVVDDEELLREILQETFSMHGAQVDSAEGGNKAFEMLKSKKYDVLISDVRMPNGDGISLMSRLKAEPQAGLKLFVCSAYNDLTEEKIKDLGIIKVFSKPFDIEILLKEVHSHLNNL